MTTEEMMKMCRSLAHKYNSPSHFDDLVSEGMLECLEQVDQGNTHGANLRRMANRAMHDYMNLKNLPVTVPVTTATRSLARDTLALNAFEDNSTMSQEGVAKLQRAIKSTSTPLESAEIVDEESDPAVVYEKKQTVLDTVRIARDTLNDKDWSLFSRHYLEKETTDDIAISERVTRQAVEKKLKRCVNKVTEAMNI